MKAPYYLPEYRCGECHSAMYTRVSNPQPGVNATGIATCGSRTCAQQGLVIVVELPRAVMVDRAEVTV
jgi:hypothetical protein